MDRDGALGEYFEEDWTPLRGPVGSVVEPGHQFEWAWVLGEYARLSGARRRVRLNIPCLRLVLGFQTGTPAAPIDLTGIALTLRWHPVGANGQPNAVVTALAADQYLTNGGATGGACVMVIVPRS